jgi:hypothetical protein
MTDADEYHKTFAYRTEYLSADATARFGDTLYE